MNIEEAEAGKAKRFAMTLWDHKLLQDEFSGELWYCVPRLEPDESKDRNRSNLCRSLRIAAAHSLAMIGFLKDHVERPNQEQKCSTKHAFTITNTIEDEDDGAIYLRLLPHIPSDLGCVPTVRRVVKPGWKIDQLAGVNRHLTVQVDISSHDRAARLKRLESAAKFREKHCG